MRRLHFILVIVAALAPALHLPAFAQSGDMSLGDVARSYRKSQTPPGTVIDNDNLSEVIEDGETRKWATTTLRFSLDPSALQMVNASPDVTCALAFHAQTDPMAEAKPQTLPASEMAKLDGPATIAGDALQVSLYNGSTWDIRELTVSITVVKKQSAAPVPYAAMKLLPAALTEAEPAERPPDATVLYHLKGSAAPFTTTSFREVLSAPLPPGLEWHWAILQAKGIPPAPGPEPSK